MDIGGNLLDIDVTVEHRVLGVDSENLEAASSCDAFTDVQWCWTNASKTNTKEMLTVEGAEFQLQLAEASWRADSGSAQGT